MRNAPLKIGYFADGIWGQNALKKIYEDKNFEICFVVLRFETPDKRLAKLAKAYKIPIFQSHNVNSSEFISQIQAYECDLLVSMSFNQIFLKHSCFLAILSSTATLENYLFIVVATF